MSRGTFVTFEGGEGAGKSTVVPKIAKDLEEKGYETLVSREPGGVASAEQIRAILLGDQEQILDEYTEVLLFAAARRQHLVEKIIPALEAGKVVLCDRYLDSSLAYQGYASGVDMEQVKMINMFAVQHWLPERTIFLDLPVEIGLSRITKNAREENRLDQAGIDFHERVREGYQLLAKEDPERYRIVQANQSMEQVEKAVLQYIQEVLG
ncbi:dTMP kinase [Geomicrobium halophilum]|uniref:Thymidylate kinase n=1 Tax=Geomicrobium halophilum TaxID=549000 RepID=A0A841PW57_9BACL|nr:dTMP kinase [Geomicrobium halophilum]MBB6451506.1 dTMP kinase [Geomicrobium halophilum]